MEISLENLYVDIKGILGCIRLGGYGSRFMIQY